MSAIEHRFRPVRKQAEAIRQALEQNLDPKDLPLLDAEGMGFYLCVNTYFPDVSNLAVLPSGEYSMLPRYHVPFYFDCLLLSPPDPATFLLP